MNKTDIVAIAITCVALVIFAIVSIHNAKWTEEHKEELEKKREARVLARKEKEAKPEPQGSIGDKVFVILLVLVLVGLLCFAVMKMDLHYLG